MEFGPVTTAVSLVVTFLAFSMVFLTSPMPSDEVILVLLTFVAYGVLVFFLGFRYGGFRATRPRSDDDD